MRILIHSNGPHVPSGYGVQCNILTRQLKAQGHDVAVSCLYGLSGQPIRWDGITLYPAGRAEFSPDVLGGHAASHQADLVITLMDNRMLNSIAQHVRKEPWGLISWVPVDTDDRLSYGDQQWLHSSGAFPVGMSEHGTRMMRAAGFENAITIPHSVDLDTFRPPVDREAIRRAAEVDDKFVIGLNAANTDAVRKAFPEQLKAFSLFHRKHPDSILMLHTALMSAKGHNLYQLCDDFGIGDAVKMTDQYVLTAGLMNQDRMAEWYGACDILTLCSYAEGFGIPLLEAQACGVPVVTTDASAMTELCGSGWLVGGEPYWNPVHRANWLRPSVRDIVAAYESAYDMSMGGMRKKAREFSLGYDAETTGLTHWAPLLSGYMDSGTQGPLPSIYEDAEGNTFGETV